METCSICLDDIHANTNTNKNVKLDCNHLFHYDCISKIKNNKCPLCRRKIINEEVCQENHGTNFFYFPNFKKNGNCRYCKKKSFKYYLKEKIMN